MDQIKIGKFIAECRKKNNLTQMQLAEKLGITDRAVSKWETGKTMPDSALMLDLCEILGVTVNDLLNGEMVSSEDYHKKTEQRLLELAHEKEKSDKLLLWMRSIMWIAVVAVDMIYTFWEVLSRLPWVLGILSFVSLLVPFFVAAVDIRIMRQAGYYRCKACGLVSVLPVRRLIIPALFFDTMRFRCRCDNCKKKTQHIKVFTKE